ncbi:hypothetical protein AB0M95_36815 [Sphaerisporangium sp. NPDC051017]|uniref:hypothetical protein n=1 Tax=Sphaerisporangium sp. NPDC051017 TaxID=3154636 RepID=UPI00343BCB88
MMRRIACLAAVTVMALGTVVVSAGGASAAVTPISEACTATGTVDVAVTVPAPPGPPRVIGTNRFSYVGSQAVGLTAYRYWHVSYKNVGDLSWSYLGAHAVRCSGATITGTYDLTRTNYTVTDARQCTLSENFERVENFGFPNMRTLYFGYVGSRTDSADTFRYWGVRTDTGSTLTFAPAAARCD